MSDAGSFSILHPTHSSITFLRSASISSHSIKRYPVTFIKWTHTHTGRDTHTHTAKYTNMVSWENSHQALILMLAKDAKKMRKYSYHILNLASPPCTFLYITGWTDALLEEIIGIIYWKKWFIKFFITFEEWRCRASLIWPLKRQKKGPILGFNMG